jgi:ABC-2 type transport system permease protein
MKHFWTILSHEIRMLLVNPSTYIAAVLFLAVMGFEFTRILESYSQAPQEASPAIEFFRLFWLPVLFMVPLLTMRSLAEERRLGTIETLLTTPVTTTEVVLGKYGAAYGLYAAMWAATGGFFYILREFAGDPRLLDPGPLIGGYLFIAISGLLFVAIGILASSLSRNQSVAGILCFAMLFALIGGGYYLADAAWLNRDSLQVAREVAEYAQIPRHYDDFTRGVVDTRQLLFYVSGTVLALIFSILSVEARQLHG